MCPSQTENVETIAAIATAPGRGGVGVIRVSGPNASTIAEKLTRITPSPRYAHYVRFFDLDATLIDDGIVIFFAAPSSYTGEDVVELQAHGNPFILQRLLELTCHHGARSARAGEFTERAFRNGRLDLAQAEAVADLINSASLRAARSAQRTLQGDFGRRVEELIEGIRDTRALLEAGIDFADDTLADDVFSALTGRQEALLALLENISRAAQQGRRLINGAVLAIAGAPNVGKSSLLNCLAREERAIVTPHAGTTRDLIDVAIHVKGVPLRIIDTAGLRETIEPVEREGIRRARDAISHADIILYVVEARHGELPQRELEELFAEVDSTATTIVVHNKIDLLENPPVDYAEASVKHIFLSALTGAGVETLRNTISDELGIGAEQDGEFSARARHIESLDKALDALRAITPETQTDFPELAAEQYRLASQALEAIGGRYGTEELLGDIFARFCIGK